ncbi:hypothetical protein ACVNNN_21460 [Lysinibacillus fusiformis]|uniref:hypothetical protein n=1 Tax=Lysinibacillus sp. PWR01 TaxID=3342384 RepID=UPI00372CEB43
MGRETNYSSKIFRDLDVEKIKRKIHKETLTTEEIAVYLSVYGNYYSSNYDNGKAINKRTIENHIGRICDISNDLLSKEDFQINKIYSIDPNYHGLLLTLLDSNYFDGRKNKRSLSNRADLYSSLINNIDSYLLNEDKIEIINNPSYVNAALESELSKKLSNELIILLRELYHADPMFRFRLMEYVIENLNKMRKWVSENDNKMFVEKLIFGAKIDKEENEEEARYIKEKIQSFSLEEYIIKCLAEKVHKPKKKEMENEEEILDYSSIYLSKLLYQLEFEKNQEIEEHIKELDDKLISLEQFRKIDDKAKQILDLENPTEKMLYANLITLSKINFIAPHVSTKELANIKEFIEQSIQKDKWEILREFLRK